MKKKRGMQMEDTIPCMIKKINDRMRSGFDQAMKKHGLTFSQARVLRHLRIRGGVSTQKEIEDYLDVKHPTVVGLVARLEGNGFVETCTDPDDRRNKLVKITEKAIRMEEDIVRGRDEGDRLLMKGLQEEEKQELKRLLGILCKNADLAELEWKERKDV